MLQMFCTRRSRLDIIKCTGCLVLTYYIIRLLVVHNNMDHAQVITESHEDLNFSPKKRNGTTSNPIHTFSSIILEKMETSDIDLTQCTRVIHVASIVIGSEEARDFSLMLKSLLHFRSDGLQLYMITDKQAKIVLRKLLQTWELPYVAWTFIGIESRTNTIGHSKRTNLLQSSLPDLLPISTEKVIYLGTNVRLFEDIRHLWDHFHHFTSSQLLGIPSLDITSEYETTHSILLLRISEVRNSPTDLKAVLGKNKLYNGPDSKRYMIPCHWSVRADTSFNLAKCLGDNKTSALVLDSERSIPISLQAEKAKLNTILTSDGDLLREQILEGCPPLPTVSNPYNETDKCRNYRFDALLLKRRRHLSFIASEPNPRIHKTDVTLVTQFTLDRLETFARFMENWGGTTVAVLHVTDAEAAKLEETLGKSEVLKARKDISYHLVYKRQKYYPINYLRNVGLSQVRTPYLLFIDVDLVPNPNIYGMLQTYIQKYHYLLANNVTFVVAAFEAFENLKELPQNKQELLHLIKTDKVAGYRMKRKWNLGHKPTDYSRWEKENVPYKVTWKDAYEPYVLLPTKTAPLYKETLLERMGDKIAYGRELHARGYSFYVLPDVYVVHIPHAPSNGTLTWKNEKNYLKCGGILFNEYRRELELQHPDVSFGKKGRGK